MTNINKLIEILNNSFAEQYEKRGLLTAHHTANDLLSNGVIVLDTKVIAPINRPLITHIAEMPLNDVLDLIRAKKEERLIGLPCKVGDKVDKIPYNLTDNDIIKALKEILELMLCEGDLQRSATISKALDLINRLQAENERLKKGWKADIQLTAEVKAEAYKEFAERLHKEAEEVGIDPEGDFIYSNDKIYDTVADWCKDASDNLLKELVGEDNEKST